MGGTIPCVKILDCVSGVRELHSTAIALILPLLDCGWDVARYLTLLPP